jgi:hypothetical protein
MVAIEKIETHSNNSQKTINSLVVESCVATDRLIYRPTKYDEYI